MSDLYQLSITVNDTQYQRQVDPRLLLSDFLRQDLGLTGTHIGCEHGVCGACTVLFDGLPVTGRPGCGRKFPPCRPG